MNILLGVTGSVASTLLSKMVDALHNAGHEVKIIATNKSEYFFHKNSVLAKIYTEADEWHKCYYEKGDEVIHVELCNWADVLLIAPLSANTLAKITNGICDNLLTCLYRAWHREKLLIVAPAMNTFMWTHPITMIQIKQLKNWNNLVVVLPVVKKLACGEEGIGAMAKIEDIVNVL